MLTDPTCMVESVRAWKAEWERDRFILEEEEDHGPGR